MVLGIMLRTRYTRAALSLLVIVIWVVLDRREPFRSHFGLTVLGSGITMIVIGLLVYLIGRRERNRPVTGATSTSGSHSPK